MRMICPNTPVLILVTVVATCLLTSCLSESSGEKGPKILILGAGISGVTAAKRLKELGYADFRIIEGTSRVGGRVGFPVTLGGYTVDLGPIFLNGGKTNPLFPFLQKYNISYMTSNEEDWIVRDSNGSNITERAKEILEDTILPVKIKVAEYAEKAHKEKRPDYSLRSALLKGGWHPKSFLENLLEYFEIDYNYAFDAGEISGTHDFVNDPSKTVNINVDFVRVGDKGYQYMIEEMLKEVIEGSTDKLQLNQTVTEIEQTDKEATVTTKTGEKYTADYVVVTFSLGVLQQGRVKFKPSLPDWKIDSIDQFRMAHYTNIYVQFNSSFWDDTQWILYAGGRENFNVVLNFNKYFPGSNILNLEATNRESIRIEQLNDIDIVNEVVSKLQDMYGPSNITVPYPVNYGISRFSRSDLFEGSYSHWPPGYSRDTHDGLKAPVGRIYFGGEHTNYFYYGFMHGAYYSGIDVSNALDRCIRKADCENYVPSYDLRGCTYPAAINYDPKAKIDDGSCKFHCVSSCDTLSVSFVVLLNSIVVLFSIWNTC